MSGPAVVSDTASSLRARNEAALRRRHPLIFANLKSTMASTAPVSRLVIEDGAAVNIDLGNTTLYPEAAPKWSARQLYDYFADPDRIGFPNPHHCNLSEISVGLLHEIMAYFQAEHPGPLPSYPLVDVGYLFVFGVGLGHHLPELIRRTEARIVILVEPIPEFLDHALSAIDWEDVFDLIEARGGSLIALLGQTPAKTVDTIVTILRSGRQTFLDGSYAYVHYPSWPIREARVLLNEKIKPVFLSTGFFEDEVLMMGNAYGNAMARPFFMLGRDQYLEQSVPVFVAGAGPSLDRALPTIARDRDRAVVISCGTALGILLKHGIRPDFHVETENTKPLLENLRRFDQEWGLRGITLLASMTVDPEVGALFDRRWLFLRASLSSSLLMSGGFLAVPGASPLVANAAYAVLARAGFKEFYLFGVDCGRRRDAGHHARDAVYYQDDYDNYLPGEGFERLENEFDRVVPANFGGEALTTWYLDLSRVGFTNTARTTATRLFNCSDGAKIDGAEPKVPEALRLTNPAGAVARAIERVERQLTHFEPGSFSGLDGIEAQIKGCDDFTARFQAAMDEAKEHDDGFWDLERRLLNLCNATPDDHRGAQIMVGGTLFSMLRLGAFGGTRIADPDARAKFFRTFVDLYARRILWAVAESRRMFEAIATRQEIPPGLGLDFDAGDG